MKQYLLSIYQPEGDPPAPEVLESIMRDVNAVKQAMKDAGVWVFSGGLHAPSTATVLQAKQSDVLVTDGPYAEGKEYLGGFTIIRAPDLDAALEWGRKLARAISLPADLGGTGLPIEVRPFYDDAEH